MAFDMMNRGRYNAAFMFEAQSSCPIPTGSIGIWLDSGDGSIKFRAADGTDNFVIGGTDDTLVTLTGTQTLSNKTLTAPVVSGGLTASGSAANDFSGSTGAFKTSSGAITLSGATINAAANTVWTTTAGLTNTTGTKFSDGTADGSSSKAFVFAAPNIAKTDGGTNRIVSFTGASGAEQFGINGFGEIFFANNGGFGNRIYIGTTSEITFAVGSYISFAEKIIPLTTTVQALGQLGGVWGGLFNGGCLSGGYRTAASTITGAINDFFVGVTGSGSRTVNLPAANAVAVGQIVIVQDVGNSSGTISIAPHGTDNINGANSAISIAAAFGRKVLVSDGSANWYVNTGAA